jgi:hypothetical protein
MMGVATLFALVVAGLGGSIHVDANELPALNATFFTEMPVRLANRGP